MIDPANIRIAVGREWLRIGDLVTITRRTWRERLLTWPWRPWIADGVSYAGLRSALERHNAECQDIGQ